MHPSCCHLRKKKETNEKKNTPDHHLSTCVNKSEPNFENAWFLDMSRIYVKKHYEWKKREMMKWWQMKEWAYQTSNVIRDFSKVKFMLNWEVLSVFKWCSVAMLIIWTCYEHRNTITIYHDHQLRSFSIYCVY